MFPVFQRSELLPTKSQVLGLTLNGQARAYPLELLSRQLVINDILGGQKLVVVAAGQGIGARAYHSGLNRFSLAAGGREGKHNILIDQDSRSWRIEEEALVLDGDPDERLARLPSRTSYWFGWFAFNPATQVYDGPAAAP